MPDSDKESKDKKEKKDDSDDEERKRDKFGRFLQENLTKGEMALKHAIGLGQTPNVVPLAKPEVRGPSRPVEVGWHPVGGFAGKWFAEETGLGKMITEKIRTYPDPTQHWAVLVGDYAHQLWMDENFHVIYINEKVKREDWQTYQVGETRFNDDAIRRAGESVIQDVRDEKPAYNLITNNCQTYALQLLDAIKVDGNVQFGTTLSVYERLVGPGKVKDLFPEPGQPLLEGGEAKPAGRTDTDTVSVAQHVMDQNTTKLDTHEDPKKQRDREKGKDKDKDKDKEKKRGLFSRFTRK